MNLLLRFLRTIHSWLGVIVMPWVVIIGATGVYLNHGNQIRALFGYVEFSEIGFDLVSPAQPITPETARELTHQVWPDASILQIKQGRYHGRPSYQTVTDKGIFIVSRTTGHFYAKTRFTRRTFSPSGELLHTKFYWGPVLKELHETGWLGGGLRTWIADTIGIAMIFFGMSGFTLWLLPRWKRIRRERLSRI